MSDVERGARIRDVGIVPAGEGFPGSYIEAINLDEPLSEKDAEVYGGAFREVHVRVYRVLSRVAGDEVWYECPICGPLEGAVLKGHGPNHMVEDASR